MTRLQKKCFVASTGFHLLLALILVVGPGFFAPKSTMEDPPTLNFIPDTVIDGASRVGGQNKSTPAPPPPPPPPQAESHPTPKPPEPKKADPDPPKNKETKQDPESLELPKQQTKKLPQVSTKVVDRNKNSPAPTKNTADADKKAREARELADAQQRTREAFNTMARTLRSSMSSSTSVEYHGEGYGEAVASYAQVVKSIYEHAWLPPDDTASDDAITKVSVTIASDGKVIDSHIVRTSGDSLVDHSVQRTPDRVIFIRAFPEGSKDKQRTYVINFNLKAKRALG